MAKNHSEGKQDVEPTRSTITRTDPSVKLCDLYLSGEPKGSVPMATTMGKPQAYTPAKPGPK